MTRHDRNPPLDLVSLDEAGFERFIGLTEAEQFFAVPSRAAGRIESVPKDPDTRGVIQIAYSRSALYTFGHDWLGLVIDVAAGNVLLAQTEQFESHIAGLDPPVGHYWCEAPYYLPRLCQFLDSSKFFAAADAYITPEEYEDASSRELFSVVQAEKRKTIHADGDLPPWLLSFRFFIEGVLETGVWYAADGRHGADLLYERDIKPRRSTQPLPEGFVGPFGHLLDGNDAA